MDVSTWVEETERTADVRNKHGADLSMCPDDGTEKLP